MVSAVSQENIDGFEKLKIMVVRGGSIGKMTPSLVQRLRPEAVE